MAPTLRPEAAAPVKLTSLQVEGFQGIRDTLRVEFVDAGVTLFCGDIRQGKTSLLNAIATGNGGLRNSVSDPINHDSEKCVITQEYNNGLKAVFTIRKGRKGTCVVTGGSRDLPAGLSGLDAFVSQWAINAPKFMAAGPQAQAELYLRGIGVDLAPLAAEYERLYQERRDANREATRLGTVVDALRREVPTDLPEAVDAAAIAEQLKEARAIEKRHEDREGRVREADRVALEDERGVVNADSRVRELAAQLKEAEEEREGERRHAKESKAAAEAVRAESLPPIPDTSSSFAQLQAAEAGAGLRQKAESLRIEAERLKAATDAAKAVEHQMGIVKHKKLASLSQASGSIPGLDVTDGQLTYNGVLFDSLSTTEQIQLAAKIIQLEKPKCGFLLLDRMESLGETGLAEVQAWSESAGLQLIGTYTGDPKTTATKIVITEGAIAPKQGG